MEDDLSRLAAELQHAPKRAPRTAAWLKQWQAVGQQAQAADGEL